jgi:chorismate synthase
MSSFGNFFRVSTYGESHGIGVGCIIENVPPQMKLSKEDIQPQLDRRKPNQNSLLTNRQEPDLVEIYSGVINGITLGTPIMLMVKNMDMKPGDYKSFSNIPRPGHADFSYLTKYGLKADSGGGRASARETIARVAAGAVAEKYLKESFGTHIVSWVSSIGEIEIPKEINAKFIQDTKIDKFMIDLMGTFSFYTLENLTQSNCKINQTNFDGIFQSNDYFLIVNIFTKKIFLIKRKSNKIEEISNYNLLLNFFEEDNLGKIKQNIVLLLENEKLNFIFSENINIRCPHEETGLKMILEIINVKQDNDSIGGIVTCVIRNPPQSLGEPTFNKFEAELAKAMLSIPATKGFEIGSGFEGTKMR